MLVVLPKANLLRKPEARNRGNMGVTKKENLRFSDFDKVDWALVQLKIPVLVRE